MGNALHCFGTNFFVQMLHLELHLHGSFSHSCCHPAHVGAIKTFLDRAQCWTSPAVNKQLLKDWLPRQGILQPLQSLTQQTAGTYIMHPCTFTAIFLSALAGMAHGHICITGLSYCDYSLLKKYLPPHMETLPFSS
jgi:hypothetical protein